MQHIQLKDNVWHFDPTQPLGPPGGFGAVFPGHSDEAGPVAVKRLHLNAQASRELEVADFLLAHDHPHVIPIHDAGIDALSGQYFIVMARADSSLQDLINRAKRLAEFEALEIAEAIVAGLEEISELVHRDLKPGNVLLHNGVWKLADLGLARFVEAATAANTMKDFLSPHYAAPEQWRGEHATKATDVYAVGCILHALIMGQPPFTGLSHADLSRQHQLEAPPALAASAQIRRVAADCLAKSPLARPTVRSLRTQIQRARVAAGSTRQSPIAQAAALIAEARAEKEADAALEQKIVADRKAAASEAVTSVERLLAELVQAVIDEAPAAERNRYGSKVTLGTGRLDFSVEFPYLPPRERFGDWDWDVLAGVHLQVGLTYIGGVMARSANLFFGRLAHDEGYRWWEVAFAHTPEEKKWRDENSLHGLHVFGFHAETTYMQQALQSLWSSPRNFVIATNPRPIDGEFLSDFHDRWLAWISEASLYDVTHVNPFAAAPPLQPIDAKFMRAPGGAKRR